MLVNEPVEFHDRPALAWLEANIGGAATLVREHEIVEGIKG